MGESVFTITLDGEGGNLNAVLAAFKKSFAATVSDLEKQTANLKLFGTLDADLKKAAVALDATRIAFVKMRDDALSVGPPTKEVSKNLNDAAKAVAAAEREFTKQSQAVDKLRASLVAAGINVNDLAKAEALLAEKTRQAAAAQVEQQSKLALGFKTLKDVQPEINKIVAAYQALATSGKLSFTELGTAQAQAAKQIGLLRAEVTGLSGAFSTVKTSVVAFAAAFAGVVAGGASAANEFRQFSTGLAAVGTIAEVSDAKLAELGVGVRKLSTEMGVDAVASVKALYDIIGSGISADNSLEVLAASSRAARAGLTDVGTAASVGVGILNGYGLQVDQLEGVYDILFQTVRDGVVTFPELAKNIGNVIPIARAANVPLTELGAAFVVLTRGGIDAPEAATAISRAIQELAAPAPDAAAAMRELGIQFKGLFGTIEQFAAKNLSLDQIQKLIPEVRASKAVLALAQNFQLLSKEVESLGKASGAMKAAYDRMADTPQARLDRFNSAIQGITLQIGEMITASSGFIETLTKIANGFNNLEPKTKQMVVNIVALVVTIGTLSVALKVLGPTLNLVAGALTTAAATTVTFAEGLTVATAAVSGLQLAVAGFLGFKLGEILYENSVIARIFGDVLGNLVGVVHAVVTAIGDTLVAVFTLNGAAFGKMVDTFKANIGSAFGGLIDAFTGTAEAGRRAAKSQSDLGDELLKTSKAAADAANNLEKAVTTVVSTMDTQVKAVQTALTTAQANLTSLTASLGAGVDKLASQASQALGTLAAQVATKLAELSSIDVKRIQDTVAIQQEAATKRLAIISTLAIDLLKAEDTFAAARKATAAKTGEDIKKVELEILQFRQGTLQQIVDKFRAHVLELQQAYRTHIDNIRALDLERADIAQSTDEKIRLLRQAGRTDYEKYNDDLREVDRRTAAARRELELGNFENAKKLFQSSLDLAASLGREVKKGNEVVVTSASAAETAISKIKLAEQGLFDVVDKNKQAQSDAAAAAKSGFEAALPTLKAYEEQLDKVVKLANEGIKLKVIADEQAVKDGVAEVARLLEKEFVTVHLLAELKDAREDLRKAKELLAAGIPVDIKPQMQAVEDALRNIKAQKPLINVDTDEALGKLELLRTKVTDLEKLKTKSEHTITSNVDDVQKDINKLKENTESTHTIHEKIVRDGGDAGGGGAEPAPGFARGGVVGGFRAAVQRFAAGGPVFRTPSWSRVPGSGNRDTVPALLRAGSFVVKKSASQYYGGGVLNALARGMGIRKFAGGGQVTKKEAEEWAKNLPLFGGKNPLGIQIPDVTGATIPPMPESFQDYKTAPINLDTRPIPEAFLTAINVLAYAREMMNAVGANNPLLGSLKPAILEGITKVENNPTDKEAIINLLRAAETIGANPYIFAMWGKTTGAGSGTTPVWFVDWLADRGFDVSGSGKGGAGGGGKGVALGELGDFARRFFAQGALGAGPAILSGGGKKAFTRRFAGGGDSTDTVPAWLTPGEFVFRKAAASRLGLGLLTALNDMRIPRHALAGMLGAPVAVSGYATGGPVGMVSDGATTGRVGDQPINVYLQASAADILNERNIRNWVVPVMRKIEKQGGGS